MRIISKTSTAITLYVIIVLGLAHFLLGGCTERLKGELDANQRPEVWFVNIPPELARSSINPIINWIGQDRDGQIDFFRYLVLRETAVGDSLGKPSEWNPNTEPLTQAEIQSFVSGDLSRMQDTLWTYLYVRADEADPQTSNIVPMEAEISNPVLGFVPQLVFLQAFDEQGLGSEIVFRRFLRNDNPPNTRILGFVEGVPFINSPLTGLASTGIRIRWQGSDILDYPTDDPPLDYQWKLLGPYDDTTFEAFLDSFVVPVFVTNDAQVFRFGLPPDSTCDTFWTGGIVGSTIDSIICTPPFPTAHIVCDTSFQNGQEVETCDTLLIDTITASNIYGQLDELVRFEDDDFITSPIFNIVADSSESSPGNVWMSGIRDSMFNVYHAFPADTSREMNFLFWVRSRDDALVPDPTPDYRTFTVIDPKHERDLLVIDMGITYAINRGFFDSAKTYWTNVINNWIDTRPLDSIKYADSLDFINIAIYQNQPAFLRFLLGHKVVVLLNDDVTPGIFGSQGTSTVGNIYVAMQTGLNVWLAMRSPLGSPGEAIPPQTYDAPGGYRFFFGTQQIEFSGWSYYIRRVSRDLRIEDFIGALSLDTDRWPDLAIDTAYLHRRYRWSTVYYWLPSIGTLPEVNWAVRLPETEAIYLYNSLYGSEHFLGPDHSYHGRPVAHRLNRGIFRSAHFLFTPMAFKDSTMQTTVNNLLSWLYDGFFVRPGAQAGKERPIKPTTAAALGEVYWQCYWNANGDAEEFYRLLSESYYY